LNDKSAAQRAQIRYREYRDDRNALVPVGREWFRVLVFGVLLLPLGLALLTVAVLMVLLETPTELGHWGGIFFFGFSGAVPTYFAVRVILNSKASTPARGLVIFYRNLSAGYYRRAQRHVLVSDQNDFPRARPSLLNEGFTDSNDPIRFDEKLGFESYWRPVFRVGALTRMTPRLKEVEVKMVEKDVAIVSFSLKLARRSFLQLLIPSISGIFLADELSYSLTKILVRVDATWQLFNGEWMGEEEADLRWLLT
jgi:hypothetical protein